MSNEEKIENEVRNALKELNELREKLDRYNKEREQRYESREKLKKKLKELFVCLTILVLLGAYLFSGIEYGFYDALPETPNFVKESFHFFYSLLMFIFFITFGWMEVVILDILNLRKGGDEE